MPKTPQQMLLRGQNLLGYRHYADDLVEAFVERAAVNGIDVFRIFDAMNDLRNLETAVNAALATGKHAQGTMSYTVSPVHDLDYWVDMGRRLEDMGCHSICIKDMAGLLKPYVAEELVTRLKETCAIPIAMQSHATTGMSTATILKAAEAGIDMVDTAISSMSMTYGHSPDRVGGRHPRGHDRATPGSIWSCWRRSPPISARCARSTRSSRGAEGRGLAHPGRPGARRHAHQHGESAPRAGGERPSRRGAGGDPRVREELGFIPLVTPTSQIVGTQAVLNVLMGERYKTITNETAGVLKGEYGATPAPVDVELQRGSWPRRGADHLPSRRSARPELDAHRGAATPGRERSLTLASAAVDDVLTYALFPQVGLKFLENRGRTRRAFEPPPWLTPVRARPTETAVAPARAPSATPPSATGSRSTATAIASGRPGGRGVRARRGAPSPLRCRPPRRRSARPRAAGRHRGQGQGEGRDSIAAGELILMLEAMKMETEVRSPDAGTVLAVRSRRATQVASKSARRCLTWPDRHGGARALAIHRDRQLTWGQLLMMLVGVGLIYLAIAKRFEPLLLVPIGFGAILSQHPGRRDGGPDGMIGMIYHVGVETGIFPLLIFLGVGALTDFGALIARPSTLLLGAAAQFGIFAT
jgi:oxaloacetate decarboxylase (Na+ extruding) subunit alpha